MVGTPCLHRLSRPKKPLMIEYSHEQCEDLALKHFYVDADVHFRNESSCAAAEVTPLVKPSTCSVVIWCSPLID